MWQTSSVCHLHNRFDSVQLKRIIDGDHRRLPFSSALVPTFCQMFILCGAIKNAKGSIRPLLLLHYSHGKAKIFFSVKKEGDLLSRWSLTNSREESVIYGTLRKRAAETFSLATLSTFEACSSPCFSGIVVLLFIAWVMDMTINFDLSSYSGPWKRREIVRCH